MSIDIASLQSLAQRFGKSYRSGTLLFAEGDTSTGLCIILKGRIRLYRSLLAPPEAEDAGTMRHWEVGILGPGDFFGEMATFTGRPRSASAEAIDDALVLIFDRTSVLSLMQASPRFIVSVIETLCDRIQALDRLVTEYVPPTGSGGAPQARLAPQAVVGDTRDHRSHRGDAECPLHG